jgi:hypothetical protein
MKYVYCGPHKFRIFGDIETHRDVAAEMGAPVLSAGFCRFTANGLEVYGESESLGIKSDPRHARPMSIFLGGERRVA